MASRPPPTPSSIQDAQRNRVVVDAIVQAGLSARIAFSLLGGLAGEASRFDDDELKTLASEAQQAAERAKNADMSLDMAFVEGKMEGPEALREAATALRQAADAFDVAAGLHERTDEVRTQPKPSDADGTPS